MSLERPIPHQDQQVDQVALVEWGGDEPPRTGRRLGVLAGLGRDPRLVPVLGGLGAIAVFASLLGEWTTLWIPVLTPGVDTLRQVPVGVAEVPTFGGVYLVGVLGITGCLALVLFGGGPVRRNAQVLGLALAGGVLAVLAAATLTMGDTARLGTGESAADLRVDHGRGLVMAYAGTTLLGLALYLAGRLGLTGPGPAGAPPAGADPAADTAMAPVAGRGLPWQRSRSTPDPRDDDGPDPGPRDLTVGPTTPFAAPDPPDRR